MVSRWREALRWLLERVARFPRGHRYVLGERIGLVGLDVLESLLEAAYVRDKATPLARANLRLETLRHLVRMACDLRCLSMRQYEYIIRELEETGKMVGGWRRQQRRGEAA